MLRKRSSPLPSPSANHHQQRNKPKIPSPFLSPRHLLVGLPSKGGFSPVESTMSPTSVLETNNSSSINNPFFPFTEMLSSPRRSKPTCEFDTKPIGLGLVDVLDSDKLDKMVLIGSKLRTKAPCGDPMPISRSGSIEFGIKNRESQLALFSPKWRSPLPMERQSSRVMNVDEMEMSEDYTCVIAHGPNPRKTHIFDNCVVESCGGAFWEMPRDEGVSNGGGDFLSFCQTCKRSLGEGRDIFMYRGEKGFCSVECRDQAIQFDEATDNSEI